MYAWIAATLDGFSLLEATLVLVGGAIVTAFLVQLILVRGLRVAVRRTETSLDDVVFESLRWPVVLTIALVGVWALSQTPVAAQTLLDRGTLDTLFARPALSLIVVAWAWSLNRVVEQGITVLESSDRHYDAAPVFSNVWTLAVAVVALSLLLTIWRIEITPLLGAAGIAGIAIGFAAKDTVANFFGGLALYFDDTYKLGDFVVLESGESGTVVKIGIRSTTLLTRSEVLVTVPNSMLNAGKVVNESAPQRRKRIKVAVSVAYGTDLDAFETAVIEVAAGEDLVLESPEPRMRFRAFGGSGLEYELLCWIDGPKREGRARHALLRGIDTALREAGIEIPYPKRDVALTGVRLPSVQTEDGEDRLPNVGSIADPTEPDPSIDSTAGG